MIHLNQPLPPWTSLVLLDEAKDWWSLQVNVNLWSSNECWQIVYGIHSMSPMPCLHSNSVHSLSTDQNHQRCPSIQYNTMILCLQCRDSMTMTRVPLTMTSKCGHTIVPFVDRMHLRIISGEWLLWRTFWLSPWCYLNTHWAYSVISWRHSAYRRTVLRPYGWVHLYCGWLMAASASNIPKFLSAYFPWCRGKLRMHISKSALSAELILWTLL